MMSCWIIFNFEPRTKLRTSRIKLWYICRIIPVLVEHKISQYFNNSLIQTKVVYFPIFKRLNESLCYMLAAIILCVQLDVVDIFLESKIIVFHIDHLLLSHWVSYFCGITTTSATKLSHDFNKHLVEFRSRVATEHRSKWFVQFREDSKHECRCKAPRLRYAIYVVFHDIDSTNEWSINAMEIRSHHELASCNSHVFFVTRMTHMCTISSWFATQKWKSFENHVNMWFKSFEIEIQTDAGIPWERECYGDFEWKKIEMI